jgi:acetyl esterase
MPLDPQARFLLDAIAKMNSPDLSTLPPETARALFASSERARPAGPPAHVEARELASSIRAIPVRIYRPLAADRPLLPALVYFHSGGFVIGGLDTSDAACRALATQTPCVVINVDYALAPEHKFPAALEDAYAAIAWVQQHAAELRVDAARLAVAGESAGGNLATVVSKLARDRGGPPIAYQVLIYPVTDLSNFDTASYREHADGKFLTRATMRWFAEHYLSKPEEAIDPRVSPLLAEDLAGLPPALVITAGFDPLHDEGAAYAQRLERSGVATRLSPYPGMIHDFVSLSGYLDAGKQALTEVAAALRGVFDASREA